MNRFGHNSIGLLRAVLLILIGSVAAPPTSMVVAQQPTTTRYVYDDNGRLRAVIAPSGEAAIYDYDPAGNITAIRRLAADAQEIIDFAPRQGVPGNRVRIYGVGFGGNASAVSFNGVSARITGQSANLVVTEVPEGATTGPITLTTPRGVIATPTPFVIAGVRVVPSVVSLLPGQVFQFTAQIPGVADQRVRWFVNDVRGGSATVGTITEDGVYVAPELQVATVQLVVSAVSVAVPGLLGEAQVIVTDTVYSLASGAVSVRYGPSPSALAAFIANTDAVSIRYGQPPAAASAYPAVADAVSLRYGDPPATASAYAALADALSVRYGDAPASSSIYAALADRLSIRYGDVPTVASSYAALAAALSIRYGAETSNSAAVPVITSVSVTSGPVISGVAPNRIARGATATLTINGVNLGGATAIRFINANNTLDANVTAANLSVNAAGTTLTATVNVNANAAAGLRALFVRTPAGRSQTANLGANTIEIIP